MLDYKSFLFRVPKRHQNTCSWVIDNPSFLEWRDGKTSNAFWLHGYPGLGKSVVAKFVLETLSEYASSGQFTGSSKPLVCYFFCSDTDDRAKCPRNLVASIIYQLLYEDPQLAKGLKKKYTTITDEFTRSVWELWNVLGLVLADLRSRPLYIVIDALDELEKPSWRTFLEELRDTITPSMRNIRLFITSRTEPDIEKIVSSWNAVNLTINDSSGNRSGLSIFLRDVVHDYAAENSFDKEITRTICEELVTRADGMFLWASLAWEHFKDGVGSWKITVLRQKLEELQQLPPGMENLYFRLLSTVDKRVQWELIHILHWLVAARRPLSIAEISVALALKEEPEKVQDMDVRVSLRAFLKRTCPHMIRIDQAGMLTVVHQSFKDFLLQVRYINQKEPNPFHINIIQANRQLGRDCMVYVGLEELAQDKEEIWVFLDNTNVRHPNPAFLEKYIFLDYASLFWSSHIKGVDDDLPFYRNFLRVVGNKKSYQALCFSRHIHSAEDLPLFTAGKADLFGLMRRLVEDGHDINALNRESSIVHLWGCDLTTSRLRVLLELGADMNAVNSLGYTFLTNLSRLGRANDLREILKYPEFDVNAGGSQRMTPLHAAVIHKPQKAQELLDALMTRPELDFDSEDSSGRTPLTFAIHWGKEAIAKTLLKNPKVDIAKARMQGESPLINATCQCWTEIVLSILNRLDNIDGFCDSSGRTILHWTIIVGMDDALKLALTKDCSILEASDNRGMTALHYSAHEGQYHATELLISQGARPRGRTTFGETVLHLAAARGHERILRLLLKNTEDPSIINEKDLMGWTVAHRAIISGNEDLVKYLVALEIVDWTKVDRHGRTPLAFAAAFAPLSILQIVLGARKQANGICFIDAFGNTLLHLAASGNNESTLPFILERLLDKGNQPNKWGKTVLDLIPLTSPARETLVKAGLRHSKQFSERVATSLSKKEVREESPDRSDWQLQVLPPDYESEENYGDNQPDIQLSETPQWIEPVIT
ncbi:hypothetical protein N7462_001724 [Penicillium macrosclerotiorum]|uniref:uncharacterized protein n=1 Tax=Penicillium macrosclerotiorum TaxID=303699 RepID=UPI00254733C2|nr:uncharacterized protein N7462_001724 [Penicillium macrosclerotiorum]KAJ5692301.1 hypothetical protein N7462_001724 [Penicillium macrosclerotiorum]